jgi:hypothetical protein
MGWKNLHHLMFAHLNRSFNHMPFGWKIRCQFSRMPSILQNLECLMEILEAWRLSLEGSRGMGGLQQNILRAQRAARITWRVGHWDQFLDDAMEDITRSLQYYPDLQERGRLLMSRYQELKNIH